MHYGVFLCLPSEVKTSVTVYVSRQGKKGEHLCCSHSSICEKPIVAFVYDLMQVSHVVCHLVFLLIGITFYYLS